MDHKYLHKIEDCRSEEKMEERVMCLEVKITKAIKKNKVLINLFLFLYLFKRRKKNTYTNEFVSVFTVAVIAIIRTIPYITTV